MAERGNIALVFLKTVTVFEKMLSNFFKVASLVIYKKLILDVAKAMKMAFLNIRRRKFLHHLRALYATDVMFQRANKLCGNIIEARPYFSAKHKLHRFITEAYVLPKVICISLLKHRKGGNSDISIFLKQLLER